MRQPKTKLILTAITLTAVLLTVILRFDAVWRLLKQIHQVVQPLLLGTVLALAVDCPVSWVERTLFARRDGKWVRPVSVLISWVSIILVIAGLLWFSLPDIIATLSQIIQKLPFYLERAVLYLEKIAREVGITFFQREAIVNELAGSLEQFSQSMSAIVVTVYDFFKQVLNLVLGFVFSFYVLLDKTKIKAFLRRLLDAVFKERTGKTIFEYIVLCADTFKAFVAGQVIEAMILGILCFIGMNIIRLPFAPVISVLIALTSVVPVLGPYLGTLPAMLLFLLENPIQALIFLLFMIPLQQFENVIIYPKVVGNAIGAGGLLVFIGVILGAGLGGVGGLLIGVPLIAVLHAVVQRLFSEKKTAGNVKRSAHKTSPEAE